MRGVFAPGHGRRADALLTEMEFGSVANRVRTWLERHPGRTLEAEYRHRHPTAAPRVARAREIVDAHTRRSGRLASEELIRGPIWSATGTNASYQSGPPGWVLSQCALSPPTRQAMARS